MKKILLSCVAVVLGLSVAGNVLAVKPNGPSAYNGLNKGKSEMAHLELYQKNPSTWEAVADGAFGKVSFDNEKFVFNGHKLAAETNFTLIRYTDPWPGTPVACLGSAISNEEGDVHIKGAWQEGGAKVWLILSSDVNCQTKQVIGWHPTEYLFEYNTL